MKINWHQNPFFTTIEIDDRDKYMILMAYQNEEYTDLLCGLDMELDGKYKTKLTDIEIIKEKVNKWNDVCNLTIDSKEIQSCISSLDSMHFGDCTCVPCSCDRCWAESMVGVDTLKGLGKHEATKVLGAFGKDGNSTIDEAVIYLEKTPEYKKPDTWPDSVGYDIHIPRWEKERESALKWLKRYKEEHGF